MAILGGATLPPIKGKIADLTHNLQLSLLVPLPAYAYVAFYGLKGHLIGRVTQTQGEYQDPAGTSFPITTAHGPDYAICSQENLFRRLSRLMV